MVRKMLCALVAFVAAGGIASAQDATRDLKWSRLYDTVMRHGVELEALHRNVYRPPVQAAYAPSYGSGYSQPAYYQGVVYYPQQGQQVPQFYDESQPYGYGRQPMPQFPQRPYYPVQDAPSYGSSPSTLVSYPSRGQPALSMSGSSMTFDGRGSAVFSDQDLERMARHLMSGGDLTIHGPLGSIRLSGGRP